MPLKALVTIDVPKNDPVLYFTKIRQPIPLTNVDHHSEFSVTRISSEEVILVANYGGKPWPNLRGSHETSLREGERVSFYGGSCILHELGIRKCTKVTIKAVPEEFTLPNSK